jgi:tetratricopeptide (TPR) repeat protein
LLEEVIKRWPKFADSRYNLGAAHFMLGVARIQKGDVEGAIRAYQAALKCSPEYAKAHCNLRDMLQQQGRFAEALRAYKRGHELGSKTPGWPHPSAQWTRNAEQVIALEDKLPKLLKGGAQPADAAEQLALARWCLQHKRMFASATRFYTQAFAAQPELARNLETWDRYTAACAAALAGCGRGEDAARFDDRERARLRQQALDWLHADLALRAKQVATSRPQDQVAAQMALGLWLVDTDFAGVRGEALAKFAEAERDGWRKLWAEVADTLARPQAPADKKQDKK